MNQLPIIFYVYHEPDGAVGDPSRCEFDVGSRCRAGWVIHRYGHRFCSRHAKWLEGRVMETADEAPIRASQRA